MLTFAQLCYCSIILLIGSIGKIYQSFRKLYIYLSLIDQLFSFQQNQRLPSLNTIEILCALLNKVCYCNTPFFVFKTTHIKLCINTHLFMCSPNTLWFVPMTHLKLRFVLVLNFTHFQVCSAERCVLLNILMRNKAHL